MAQLYRKSALDKLSTPDQLDKMIILTPPSMWIALVGAVLIIVAVVVWSIVGTLPVNLSAQGMYVNIMGTGGIYASASGIVVEDIGYTDMEVKEGDVLAVLDTNGDGCDDESDKVEIKAPADGTISGYHIELGSYVSLGQEVARLRYDDGEFSEYKLLVLYVPINDARKVQEGMKVMVYPATVNKQTYGHMEAEVRYVDNYVTSTDDMILTLGDEQLVSLFTGNGPVAQVYCLLRTDENTASGYYWSSEKGADVTIDEGTMMEADIVLEDRAPISILLPYLSQTVTTQ